MFQYKTAPKIETDHLIIRVVNEDDAKDFFEFCSDSKVCEFLTFNSYKSLSQTKRIINNMINAYIHGSDVNFSIVLKSTQKVIGSISLNFKKETNEAEVGYLLNSSYWNNGFASEALKSVITIAFDYYNVDVLLASYVKDNVASEKLLKKNNFKIYTVIENGFCKNNKYYDLIKCYRYK